MTVDRREFLKVATVGAGATLAGASALNADPTSKERRAPAVHTRQQADIVIIGAGNFGMWSALNLQRLGANVTVIDPFGAGNSRQTSGGETRGVRSSYGDRPHGFLWTDWASQAIGMWEEWDAENADRLLPHVFYNTGDLILRAEMEPYLEDTQAHWTTLGVEHEVLDMDEVRRRWPWIKVDAFTVALYEPAAGVVRARRAIESVAQVFLSEGGKIELGLASLGEQSGGRLQNVAIQGGDPVSASTFVFACGPWFPKVFPELMANRLRISIGHVFYFGLPAGDTRWVHPNMPSYGVPGCTGWPAIGRDHRGLRVRTGGRAAEDPDLSDRWIPMQYHERPRQILEDYFPDLVGAPILETRACHYESSVDSNFIIDHHPGFENVWLAGGGSAESFKFGPLLGRYIGRRMMGVEDDPELAEGFRLKDEEFSSDRR